MFKLFGDKNDRAKNINVCHQDLLKRGALTRFEDLPLGAFVIFISHQWTGFDHPDPKGIHMKCMIKMFRQLRDGRFDVHADPFHTILYQEKHRTTSEELSHLFSNAFVWYDFWSQPQPTLEESPDLAKVLRKDLFRAIESVGAYVERADCLAILTPGTVHVDRVKSCTGRGQYL